MGKFLIKKVPTGFKFDLKDAHGDTVATGEVYTTKASCIKGAQGIIAVAPNAPTVMEGQVTKNPKFEVFRDKKGQFRFRLLARNGKIIAISEAHMTYFGCERAIDSVRSAAQKAAIEEI